MSLGLGSHVPGIYLLILGLFFFLGLFSLLRILNGGVCRGIEYGDIGL